MKMMYCVYMGPCSEYPHGKPEAVFWELSAARRYAEKMRNIYKECSFSNDFFVGMVQLEAPI